MPFRAQRVGDFLTATPPVLPAREGFPLVETLTRDFGVPVWMRSSVETMTMGELHAGAGIGTRSMLFLKVGRRIGRASSATASFTVVRMVQRV